MLTVAMGGVTIITGFMSQAESFPPLFGLLLETSKSRWPFPPSESRLSGLDVR